MSLPPGSKLDSYEVLGLLGAGGMGEVYRARDSVLKREVAIKVLPSFVSQNPDRLRRFEQEAQAAAALNHPNILAVHQFGAFEGAPYLVTELLEGGTLRQQLERGPIPVRKAIEYGVQIARGLAAAHEKGIVHRDLKPENLFVTKDGRLKILDFGLAKLMQPSTASDGSASTLTHQTDPGLVMGTAGYMSPEQVRGQSVDHRADIFAFGAILYEMLSGRRAFHRATNVETMTAILNEDPPATTQLVQTTPPGLQRVTHRCLEKNPEQRFQSASDLAFALEALSESGSSAPITAIAPAPRVSRKWLLWPAVLIPVLAIAAFVSYLIARRNASVLPRVSGYAEITHSGNTGDVIGTDGARLYVALGRYGVGEVAIAGGEIAPMQVGLPNPVPMDISPDGSKFIVGSTKDGIALEFPLWSVSVLGASHQYLAAGVDASSSPDGSEVAYLTRAGKLGIVRSDGADARTVASLGSGAWSPVWSPDGKTLRFSKRDGLWEISSTGADLHPVLPGWKGETCCGHWAPDGDTFYFNSVGQIFARYERRRLFHKSPPAPVQLTTGPITWGSPIPSRDGKKIFAQGAMLRGELTRFDPQTKQPQPYLGGISAESVAFSPDAQSIAFVSYPECVLWKARRDGGDRVQLTSPPRCPWLPRWSPDGTLLSFVDYSDAGGGQAYIVPSQGGTPQRILPEDKERETDPTWSPDGTQIVFSNSLAGGKDPDSVLKIFDLKTRKVSTIPGSTGTFAARWSPDGRSISSLRADSGALNILDVKTQQWSVLYKAVLGYPSWSADSKHIYFLDFQEKPAVFRIRVADGVVERVIDLKNFDFTGNINMWMGLDPTDAPLFLRNLGTHDIYALTLEKK